MTAFRNKTSSGRKIYVLNAPQFTLMERPLRLFGCVYQPYFKFWKNLNSRGAKSGGYLKRCTYFFFDKLFFSMIFSSSLENLPYSLCNNRMFSSSIAEYDLPLPDNALVFFGTQQLASVYSFDCCVVFSMKKLIQVLSVATIRHKCSLHLRWNGPIPLQYFIRMLFDEQMRRLLYCQQIMLKNIKNRLRWNAFSISDNQSIVFIDHIMEFLF